MNFTQSIRSIALKFNKINVIAIVWLIKKKQWIKCKLFLSNDNEISTDWWHTIKLNQFLRVHFIKFMDVDQRKFHMNAHWSWIVTGMEYELICAPYSITINFIFASDTDNSQNYHQMCANNFKWMKMNSNWKLKIIKNAYIGCTLNFLL